jgi:hypothetical protein
MDVCRSTACRRRWRSATKDEAFVLILEQLQAAVGPRLADPRIPDRVVSAYAETLRKASVLYHYDVRAPGGTTAPVVAEPQEKTRYWAFDHLIASSSQRKQRQTSDIAIRAIVVAATGGDTATLLKRRQAARSNAILTVSASNLRARASLTNLFSVREEEILYVLRHLVTMTLWEGVFLFQMATANLQPHWPRRLRRRPGHLFAYYPLLLELAFVPAHLPAMWILPSEHVRLFAGVEPRVNGERGGGETGR